MSSTVVVYVLLGLNTGPFSLRVTVMLTVAVAVCVATPLLMACTRSYKKKKNPLHNEGAHNTF